MSQALLPETNIFRFTHFPPQYTEGQKSICLFYLHFAGRYQQLRIIPVSSIYCEYTGTELGINSYLFLCLSIVFFGGQMSQYGIEKH